MNPPEKLTLPPSTTLGLDIGQKRVGMALYHPGQGAIVPLPTRDRAGKRAEQEVGKLIEKHAVSLIVVGVPLSAQDQQTEQATDIAAFVHRLSRRCEVPIDQCDEFLSSEEAKELLGITGNPSREVREAGVIDTVAACVILQRFLQKKGLHPNVELGPLRRQVASLLRSSGGFQRR